MVGMSKFVNFSKSELWDYYIDYFSKVKFTEDIGDVLRE